MISKPGIYTDMSAADYFADPAPAPSLTQSLAKILLDRSPRHAWLASPKLNPRFAHDADGYDKDRIIGSAAHAYMLGRGKQVVVLSQTNFRTKEAQEVRDSCFDAGQIPILPHHDEAARAMVDAAWEQLRERGISLVNGHSEVAVACQDGGIWFRSLIDWLSDNRRTVLDYKSSAMSCAPHAVASKMKSDHVDVQAAMHEFILNRLDPDNAGRREHWFIFQENEQPYALTAFPLDEVWMSMGRKQLATAETIWRSCMKSGIWPRYPLCDCPEYPSYLMNQLLAREIADAERGDRSRVPFDQLLNVG